MRDRKRRVQRERRLHGERRVQRERRLHGERRVIGGRASPVSDVGSGVGILFDGLRMLRRERRLWAPAGIPFAISLLLLALALGLVVGNAGAIHAFVTGWMPALDAEVWYAWLWIGPAKGALALLGLVLFLAATGAALVVALLLSNLLGSPFLDELSRRVEQIESGSVLESEGGLAAILREGARAVGNELRRLRFFLVVWGAIVGLGALVPGGQVVAPPALVVFTALFLPLEYAGFVLDRRQVPFRERRAWVWANLPRMVGFGAAAMLVLLVPVLNLVVLPGLVVGGSLLALRHPPSGSGLASSPS